MQPAYPFGPWIVINPVKVGVISSESYVLVVLHFFAKGYLNK